LSERRANLTREQLIKAWDICGGSPQAIAEHLGIDVRVIYRQRRKLYEQEGILLKTVIPHGAGIHNTYGWQAEPSTFQEAMDFTITDGCMIVASDAHYWPLRSPFPLQSPLAHRALLKLLKQLKPKLVALNGDFFDGSRASRFDAMGWQELPTIIEELDAVKQRFREIEGACGDAQRWFGPGNHDTRFDRQLATNMPEYKGVPGMRIKDHLEGWPMAYVAVVNRHVDVPVLVMHNFRGGIHGPWTSVQNAGPGCTIILGHNHSQKNYPLTGFFRTAYGVDAGCIADVDHPAFSWAMARPRNWRSGFCVLTFDRMGRHLPPEFCEVQRFKNHRRAVFRGAVILEDDQRGPDGAAPPIT